MTPRERNRWVVVGALVVAVVVLMAGISAARSAPVRFPKNPTMLDVKKRVPDWYRFVRLARCEQPGSGKWGVDWDNSGPTYGGGLGIYKGTWYTAGSPYPLWGTIPETLLVADAIRDRFGITAWGAWRCF